MRAAVFAVVLLTAFPAAAQATRAGDPERPAVMLDATLIVGDLPRPSYRQPPRAPEPGRRRGLPLRADFRDAVLASAGAL